MRKHNARPQRTLRNSAEVHGVGFLTGATIQVRFLPAPPSSGVVFVRTDLAGRPRIPAHVTQVTGTARRTTLGRAPVQVTLVEHVLASLAGLRIDNCLVELNAVEPPGLDGSALGFVEALLEAGIVEQSAPRSVWSVSEPVTVRAGEATLTLHPPETDQVGLWMSYFLDYGPTAPIVRQVYTREISSSVFLREIASCRTFLLQQEAEFLRAQGLGSNTTPKDLLIFGRYGVIGNTLRFANEPARHKVLDMIGDLSLLGTDLRGHLIACRSGHPLNVELARVLHARLVTALGRAVAA